MTVRSPAPVTSIGASTEVPVDSLTLAEALGDALEELDESDEQAVSKMPTAATEVARTRVRFAIRMARA